MSARDPAPRPESAVDTLLTQSFGPVDSETVLSLVPTLTADLAEIDARIRSVLEATYPRVTDAATYAVSAGGKRIRPLLMAVTARALGLSTIRTIVPLAAAVQLIHTATLVHDDVIDHAEKRRGRPSMPRAFGLPSAIVTGDYLFVRAFELASEYPRPIILRCGESCAALVEGETLQESGRFDLTSGREHYYRVIERKTAATIAAALASVAEVVGASPERVEACAAFGRSLGIAFQIRDDLLDVYGDPDLLGKPLYGDLREGNPTLLSLEAHAELRGADRAEFEKTFGLHRKRSGDLLRLRALTDSTRAADRVAGEATQWADRAVRSIEVLPSGPYRTLLEGLARGAAARPF